MSPPRLPRLPYAALERFIASRWPMGDDMNGGVQEKGRPSAERMGRLTGVSGRTMILWRRDGLTPFAADRAATALGVHPLDIWPDFHADLLDEVAS